MRRAFFLGFFGFFGLLGFSLPTEAAPPLLTFKYAEQIFELRPSRFPKWKKEETVYTYRGFPLLLPAERAAGALPKGLEVTKRMEWDKSAIAASLEKNIGTKIDREAGAVRIGRDPEGNILFEGVGLPGRKLESDLAAELTIAALTQDIATIQLPVTETEPHMTVEDATLQAQGIRELVTTGESDFTGSPANRRHNISIGLAKFNGHLIPEGAEFSFNDILGPVNAQTGYRKELTILGERVIPDFGGGLCQVSTTAYRGTWLAGFPIPERRNHSFAVTYYSPFGTDATIFPPQTDMRFLNDSPGSLLIQTFSEGNKAYFLYYGTKVKDRTVDLIGPFTWDFRKPGEDRTMYTTEIPPEEKRIVSKAVTGMKALWYRVLTDNAGKETFEPVSSFYEARPNIEEIGVLPDDPRLVTESDGSKQETDLSGVER